jgi:two-component system, response regulator / RNA-binding antiterminator
MLKVMMTGNETKRSKALMQSLLDCNFEVLPLMPHDVNLTISVTALMPDLVIIDIEYTSETMLENISNMNAHNPRPVIIFTQDSDKQKIKAATQAGVSAYVVGNIPNKRLVPVIDVAIARFEEFKQLRAELNLANTKLDERKIIERAKGILMKQRDLDEDASYSLLRSMAMQKNMKLADLSSQLVEAAKMLII